VDIVRATHDVVTEKGTIRAGDVFLVDSRLGGWKIIGGNFDGYFLQDREISFVPEYVQLKQELLQRREEVQQLIREIGELRAKTALRIPALPRKVAEALEKERGSISDNAYILWKSSRDDAKKWKYFSILHEFVNQRDNIFKLADALRYGYTIKEQTISDEIVAIIDDCGDDRRRLADRLTDLFETRLEQEREKSG
jgi:hypothetical protein